VTTLRQSLQDLGHRFWYLWLGESITGLGAQLVQFALGVWIFQRTGSVLDFAGSIVAGTVPALLVMPFAGAMADRADRRRVIITCDCIGSAMSFGFVALVWAGRLEVWHLYVFAALSSTIGAFHSPAYQASVNAILSQERLARASGAMSLSQTGLGIVAPTLAGVLMGAVGLAGLLSLDFAALVFGTLLVWTAFANVQADAATVAARVQARRTTVLQGMVQSMRFFTEDAKVFGLLMYSLIQSAMLALASTLVMPLILAHHTPQSLGLTLTCGAVGALVGSLLIVVIETPGRRMPLILACDVVLTSCVLLAGIVDTVGAYCALEFAACVAASVGASCGYALWMSKVPVARQGSVLLVLSNAALVATAVSVVGGGIAIRLLDGVLATGGALANFSHGWVGGGQPSGLALMFVLSGSVGLLASLFGLACKPLRDL
jgi:diaminobutyrate-2-oxoglutarate transaminase